MRSSKRGMEVSITFLVVLIMAIVMFGMGIMVILKMISSGESLVDEVDGKMKREMQTMLSAMEQRVAVPFSRIEVKQGKSASIIVGVLNTLQEQDFRIYLHFGGIDPGAPLGYGVADKKGRVRKGSAQECTSHCPLFGADPEGTKKKTLTAVPQQGFEAAIFKVGTKNVGKGVYMFTVAVECKECLETLPVTDPPTYNPDLYDSPQQVLLIVK